MYHIHTSATEYTDKMYRAILSIPFEVPAGVADAHISRLRSIADLSFDLLSQAQKMEKLYKLSQLSPSENKEYYSMLRLIGTMIHLLHQYQYSDQEMMSALVKRFQRYQSIGIQSAA